MNLRADVALPQQQQRQRLPLFEIEKGNERVEEPPQYSQITEAEAELQKPKSLLQAMRSKSRYFFVLCFVLSSELFMHAYCKAQRCFLLVDLY
jgi:hypothetical protein